MIAREVKYKKTGIDWLAEIPEHWQLVRLKFRDKLIMGQSPNSSSYNDENRGFPFLQGNAEFGEIFPKERMYTTEPKKVAPTGSILYSVRAPIGAVNKADKDYCIGRGLCSIIPVKTHPDFLYYITLMAKQELNSLGTGSTFTAIAVADVSNIRIPVPPFDEQEKITKYLNSESAQITHFIHTKQRFIELLKEQRQSIITHAVTKGIDENVKMNETGIEWMQKIPEHWQVRRIRYLGGFQNGLNKNQEAFGSGFPFISYSDVYQNELLPNNPIGLANVDKIERERHSVRSGDIFFTRTSETIEEIGFSSVCIDTINDATFSGFLIRFRPIEGLLSPYFSQYYFRSQVHRAFFVKEMMLVTRASLSQDLLKNLLVLLPPIDEQIIIAKYIKTETRVLDIAISKAEREIGLIKEYREAMIAEAVTGKMKFS